ncbi:MFS transporter [Rhodospirillaceae bacterium KN72]|uniref:MFS transporter n=2 Tax=Pacificispira spongiicola TaxID=2729598 RepID=A0A7Y0E491_9PROT|nr:MFS transporter [Pacificispira spongiicola]
MAAGTETVLPGKGRFVALLAVAEVLAMTLWFSATAVVPSLIRDYGIEPAHASLFTSLVQVGFVVGTLGSAILGLADRLEPRRFFAASAVIAGTANGIILFLDPTGPVVLAMRFLTGICMAGIYPVGVKIVTTWARGDRGLLVGVLVAALTLGSAFPHLFNSLGAVDWRIPIACSSLSALLAAVLIGFVSLGGETAKAPPFRIGLAFEGFRRPAMRYANFGYLGHMWELYAMWAWIGLFLLSSYRDRGIEDAPFWAAFTHFWVLAIGAAGAAGAGWIADRWGRTATTIVAMSVSAACSLLVGITYDAPIAAMVTLCLVWGIFVIADSAQFSAAISELAPANLVGTSITIQTSAGFLLTLAAIHVIPWFANLVGWEWSFVILAPGPLFGIWAMAKLRRHPDAVHLADGRR